VILSLADEQGGRAAMVDRTELLEAALDSFAEGVALADRRGRVSLWNCAAEAITGYGSREVAGQSVRAMLDAMVVGGAERWTLRTEEERSSHGSLVHLRHKAGHEVAVMARMVVPRDGLGTRLGFGVVFHSAEGNLALPHGEIGENASLAASQAELEDRLASMHEDFQRSDIPLGVLWVTVDQASGLRRTHGTQAVEAMMEKMEKALACGLKPADEIGRWGDDEFLVLSHEHNAAMLADHAQVLAGMARTTDFRWWGDRISLTVSIGAAQAQLGEALSELLQRSQSAMQESIHAGGNHITATPGRHSCSPS
jgi:PAS domain S-box-containing protein/diguanylate cyclase (GGDEF)-like protein